MQDGSSNIKVLGLKNSGDTPIGSRSLGNTLNPTKPLNLDTAQQDNFSNDAMEDVSKKMENAVKEEQALQILTKKLEKNLIPSLFGIDVGAVGDAVISGIKGVGETFTKSTKAIGEGDVQGGLSGYVLGSLQGILSLAQVTPQLGAFTTAMDKVKESGVVPEDVMNVVMQPVTTLMKEIEKNPETLKTIIQYAPPELRPLLASPIGRESLAGITDIGVQGAIFHSITKGIKGFKGSKTSTDVAGETFSENPTQTKQITEIAGRDPVKQEFKKRFQDANSESAGERPFVGSQVGDIKIKLTPEEEIALSQRKVELQDVTNRANELQNKSQVLAEQLKVKRTKATKEEYKKVNEDLADVQAMRTAIEDELTAFGSFAEQRHLKGLLPERGTSTKGVDVGGENAPSNVGFTLPKEKIVEVGNENKPLQGVPVEKSVHDYLVNRALDLFKMVKADKPIDPTALADILRQARDKGTYDQALDILRQEAFRRGKTLEFETALKNSTVKAVVEDVKPAELSDGIKISPIKDEPVPNNTVQNMKKAQEIVGEDTFKQVATEITKDKEPLLQGVFTEELANKIVEAGKLPDEYKSALPKSDVSEPVFVRTQDVGNFEKSPSADLTLDFIENASKPELIDAFAQGKIKRIDNSYDGVEYYARDVDAGERVAWNNTPKETQRTLLDVAKRNENVEGKYNTTEVERKLISENEDAFFFAMRATEMAKNPKEFLTVTSGIEFNAKPKSDVTPLKQSNRIISEELNKKADDILRENLGNTFSNPLFNYKLHQALLIKGAYHFENGVIRFSEWSKKMVEEYGDKIKPALISLWNEVQKNAKLVNAGEVNGLKEKLNKQTNPIEIGNSVKDYLKIDTEGMSAKEQSKLNIELSKLGNDIKTFINDKKIPPEVHKEVLKTIRDMENKGGKRFASSSLTYIRQRALDKGSQLTKAYGEYGGELFNRSFSSSVQFARMMHDGHSMLNVVRDIKQKTGKSFDKSYGKVVDALQDRGNATEILKGDKVAQDIYPAMEQFFNYFKQEAQKKGYPVQEDYYFRLTQGELFDEYLKGKPKLEDVGSESIHKFYTAKSNFLKERIRDDAYNIRTDFNSVYNYLGSITRELAYKDLMDYASKDFVKGVKSNKLLNQDLAYARDAIENLISPERMSKNWKMLESLKGSLYTAYLWNNPKLAMVNYFQKEVAKTLITPEAEKLANQIYQNKYQPTGRLFDAITEVKTESPAYLGESNIRFDKSRFRQLAEKYDVFRMSENSNWSYSEGAGVINSVMRQTGAKTFEQINKALENQKVFDKAVNESRDLTARTQVSPDAAFRPMAYDKASMRLLLMFTRYPLQMSDLLISSVFKKMQGVDGIRAQNILRRGLSEETTPVEMLRSIEYMRKNLEQALKEAKKDTYELRTGNKVLQSYVDLFKSKEKELNSIIKDIEPLSKLRIGGKWVKYLGISAVVSFAYRLFESELWDAVGLNKDQRKKTVGQHLVNSLLDTSPLPFYRMTSGDLFKPPIMPSTEVFLYGNFNYKGVTTDVIDYITKLIPGVNVATQMLKRVTGVSAGKLTSKQIYGSGSSSGRTY